MSDFEIAATDAQGNLNAALRASRNVSYDSTVKTAHENYSETGDYVQFYDDISTYLNGQFRYDDNVKDAWFFLLSDTSQILSVSNAGESGGTQRMQRYRTELHDSAIEMSGGLGTGISFLPHDGDLLLVRNMVDRQYKPYAMIILNLHTDNIFGRFLDNTWKNAGAAFIDGDLIYEKGDGPELPDEPVHGTRSEKHLGDWLLYTEQTLDMHTITYTAKISSDFLLGQFSSYYYIVIFSVLMAAIFMAVFLRFVIRNVNTPIGQLVKAARRIEAGDLGYQALLSPRAEELKYLTDSFNSMSERLKALFEKSIEEQLALQDARIDALQSQIDPHFLSDALEIVKWEAHMEKADKTSLMIEALSTLLSAALSRDGVAMVPLREELKYLNAYLYIVTQRQKTLRIEKSIDPALFDLSIPRLILQPLVENAVGHGERPNGGIVAIRAYEKDGGVYLEVENDAVATHEDQRLTNAPGEIRLEVENNAAITHEDQRLTGTPINTPAEVLREHNFEKQIPGSGAPEEAQSDGILNVHRRIQLVYGNGSGLTLHNTGKGRTIARIQIVVDHRC